MYIGWQRFSVFQTFLVALFVLVISWSDVTLSAGLLSVEPYVGVDMGLRGMVWKKDFGDNVYKHGALQPNLYAGLKFNPYLGIELGYEQIVSKKRDVNFRSGEVIILNFDYEAPMCVQSSVKLKGWHFGIIGYCPISCWDGLELIGTVGFAKLKTKQQVILFDPIDNVQVVKTFLKNKIAPRFSGGIQYRISDSLSIRAILLGIENTSSFNLGAPLEEPDGSSRTKMRYNTYHSLGMVLTF